jgi:hypothetical protein
MYFAVARFIGVGVTVDLELRFNQVDNPVFRDTRFGVDGELERAVTLQGRICNLDDEQNVFRTRVAFFVLIDKRLDDQNIRLGLALVVEL